MSLRLKKLILNKVYPHYNDMRSAAINLGNFHVSYKHDEKKFLVQMSSKIIQQANGFQNKSNENKLEILKVNIDRDAFIENVLNKSSPEQSAENISTNIVIDFSSPNIAKPFHPGHLRSTIIGNFIANINKYFKNRVTKLNYLGDWGTQFGILQYGLQQENIDLNKLKNDPIKNLYNVYVSTNKLALTNEIVLAKARKYFFDIEQGSGDLENWKKIREITLKELQNVYRRLGIQFDDYHWESDYNGQAIKTLLTSLEEQNIIKTDETGKKVVKVRDKDVTVLKSDNSTLYLSRDIAALLDRFEQYKFDKMLYVVDSAQTDHFVGLFEIVRRINKECAERCEHIKFGRIKGMSTRMGNVVFLNDILDEAKKKMHDKQQKSKNTRSSAMNDQTCDTLGITAVIINDLKQRRQKDYIFEWDKALQSEGDSGIKLQYLHCRLWSLEKNCGLTIPDACEPKFLTEEVVGDVVVELAKFENVLYRAHIEFEACILVNYLFRLARHVNRMFNELKLKNVDCDLAAQRLLVFHSARLVIKTGLEILGVQPLNQM